MSKGTKSDRRKKRKVKELAEKRRKNWLCCDFFLCRPTIQCPGTIQCDGCWKIVKVDRPELNGCIGCVPDFDSYEQRAQRACPKLRGGRHEVQSRDKQGTSSEA